MVSYHKAVILTLHLFAKFKILSDDFAAIISVISIFVKLYFFYYNFLVADAFTQSTNQVIFFLQIGRRSNLKLSMSGCKIIMALLISFQ